AGAGRAAPPSVVGSVGWVLICRSSPAGPDTRRDRPVVPWSTSEAWQGIPTGAQDAGRPPAYRPGPGASGSPLTLVTRAKLSVPRARLTICSPPAAPGGAPGRAPECPPSGCRAARLVRLARVRGEVGP